MKLGRVLIGGALATAVGVGAWLVWPEPPPPLVVVSDPAPPAEVARADLPDVVVVIGCTIRKDQVAMYGGPSNTTPFLAELAREGASFADTIASAPWTKAASTAILTGHDAVSIGMVEPGPGRNHRRLAPDVTTLAEHLRAAGYATVGATANPNLNALFGFEQGFDAYVQPEGLWRDGMIKLQAADLLPAVDDAVARVAAPERPLYLQLMLVDAHAPFERTAFPASDFADPALPAEVAAEVTAYRAALRDFDEAIAAVARRIERRGRDTLLVVLSDHGEGLGWPEHHGKAHGRFLAPSAVGAVWLMSGPGVGAGVRVDGVTSQVDVVPTVLGALGLGGYDGPGLDHSALLATGGASARIHAFTDTWFIDANRAAVYTDALACQRDFAHVARGGPFRDGCFDRRADPHHERPLPSPALEAELARWREARVRELATSRPIDVEPSEDVRDQLEALGYVDRR